MKSRHGSSGAPAGSSSLALTIEFVAKPDKAASAPAVLPAAITGALVQVTGFAGCLVMVSDQEARLITVVTFWAGSGSQKSCAENHRWVRALLSNYIDRCLRVQTMVAHLPSPSFQGEQPNSAGAGSLMVESIASEENVCVALMHLIEKDMKSYEIGSRGGSRGLGQMDTNLVRRNCCENACRRAAITSLDQKDYCLNHFLRQCYERLEDVDPRNGKFREAPLDLAAFRAFIEECSRRALDVSLQTENLNNLERGRLLDILLWAGELFLLLRAPRITLSDSTSPDLLVGTRAASAQR